MKHLARQNYEMPVVSHPKYDSLVITYFLPLCATKNDLITITFTSNYIKHIEDLYCIGKRNNALALFVFTFPKSFFQLLPVELLTTY